jgi:cysteinyl-tRNA synthetase
MAMKYLGPTLDLHAGGIDLCFPHHENEIAQSEGATGQCFARHWMHTAHLMVEGQKMSKSLGNLYTLADLQAKGYSALAVRYALLAGHYRQGLNFTLEALKGAETALEKLFYALQHQRHALASCVTPSPGPHAWGPLHGAWAALCDDLNVPGALGVLFGTLAQHPAYDPARDPSPQAHWALVRDTEALLQLLGLEAVAAHTEPPPAVLQAAQARWAAKQARDFAAADTARQTLKALGWTVLDQREGYMLLPANMPWRTPNA